MHTSIEIKVASDNTIYDLPSEWRLLGAKFKVQNILTLANRQKISPVKVLEVGAGDGSILRHLAENKFGHELYALELSSSGVSVINNSNIENLRSCVEFDGYHIPFENDYFDVVVLSHVLEHVEFERALLREIKRVSQYQIIEIPMDWHGLQNPSNYLMWQSYGHINAHSPASLRFLLSTEGFDLLDEVLLPFPLELEEFDYFVNNNRERNLKNRMKFQLRVGKNKLNEKIRRTSIAQKSSTYTVLTRSMSQSDLVQKALTAAEQFMSSRRPNSAQLIANRFLNLDDEHLIPEQFRNRLQKLKTELRSPTKN